MASENLESKRWGIARAAVVMQLCLGTVYAWSVFKKPLIGAHGWGETQTQLTFMIFMFTIGCAAAFGGTLVDKKGPKFVATVGGILFALSTLLAAYADQIGSLPLLYVSWGLIGGLGNGFCYVTPIATLIRWFPDKRGLVTGLAVMGFGLGAFFMGKIAPMMITAFKGSHDPIRRCTDVVHLGRHLPGTGGRFCSALQESPRGLAARWIHSFRRHRIGRRLANLRPGSEDTPVVDALGHALPERVCRSGSHLPAFPSGSGVLQTAHH